MSQPYESSTKEIILIAEAAYGLALEYSFSSPSDITIEVISSVFGDNDFGVSIIPKNDTKKERVNFLVKIKDSTNSLVETLINSGEYLHAALESKSDNLELEDTEWHRLHISNLIKDLKTLLLSSERMIQEENENECINIIRNEYREQLVSILYDVFKREKPNSSKVIYDPILNQYSGDFFRFLKNLYKKINLTKGDSGIAQDMKRFTPNNS
jgi:hypothetical protein